MASGDGGGLSEVAAGTNIVKGRHSYVKGLLAVGAAVEKGRNVGEHNLGAGSLVAIASLVQDTHSLLKLGPGPRQVAGAGQDKAKQAAGHAHLGAGLAAGGKLD